MAATAKTPTRAASKTVATRIQRATRAPGKLRKAATPVAAKAAGRGRAKATVAEAKPAVESAPVEAVRPVVTETTAPTSNVKPAKVKLVRDSFTMPADEYAGIGELKRRLLACAHPAKKSELLRAGVKALVSMGDAELLALLKSIPSIKTGRPKSKKGE